MDEIIVARAAIITIAALIAEQIHPRSGAVVAVVAATASSSFEISAVAALAATAIVGTLFRLIRVVQGGDEEEE
ncbi:hypothetical protein [Thermoflexus sp.]|uniref:hypothetical protein n=1 Tax=Thermoflexus sp. TaxID=1969742 RepID=UPI002625976F|nr:hypothetical protein [Thermoflexus sp.]MCX7690562.1 hypothetical protein [Thermoflexus sp.]